MPCYDFFCATCNEVHEQIHSMFDPHGPCPKCGRKDLERIFDRLVVHGSRDETFHSENNGKGRYIGQLAARPDVVDPNAFCRSQNEAIEKAKRQGWADIQKA